jgi:hypothetical protein
MWIQIKVKATVYVLNISLFWTLGGLLIYFFLPELDENLHFIVLMHTHHILCNNKL